MGRQRGPLGDLWEKSPAAVERLLGGDQAVAAGWVEMAARQGVVAAQLRLGRMKLDGAGMPKDEAGAWRWFMTAARSGDAEAINMVGRCHENGWGVAVDMAVAALWYGKAAERGDAWAQYNLGHLLLDGIGVARDHAAAFAWYGRAASQGHARAMNLVGRCHEEGWGTPRDPGAASMCYRASAEAGYFRGAYNHALVLLAGGKLAEARIWLARAAALGTPAIHARATSLLDQIDSVTLAGTPASASAAACRADISASLKSSISS